MSLQFLLMSLPIDENKYIFLIVDSDPDAMTIVCSWLKNSFPNSAIYSANDGTEASLKMNNAPPTVLITDLDLPRVSGKTLIKNVLKNKNYSEVQIVIVSSIPEKECYIEELVSGRVSFIAKPCNQEPFIDVVRRTVARSSQKKQEFKLRVLAQGEVLFHEGDPAGNIYLVKKGSLKASRTDNTIIGKINTNEFVGEMAHLSGGDRSATVTASEECELIEIPEGTFDTLLLSKPNWTKALMKTLTSRLKSANTRN